MLFKLDENLPASLISAFGAAGHDAATVPGQGLQGESDPAVAEACRNEERILVTLDVGFADIRAYPPRDHPGIVVLRLRNHAIPHLSATINRVLKLMAERPVANTLWIVEENRVRFRS